MRYGGILLALAVSTVWEERAGADGHAVTQWYFRVNYESGQYSESTDASVSGPILMYGGRWRCERKAAALYKTGNIAAGFACNNPSGWVNVIAYCAATSEDTDRVSAQIGDETGYVQLTARCATVVPKAPSKPAKSTDKNL